MTRPGKLGLAGLMSTLLTGGLLFATIALAQSPPSMPENQTSGGQQGPGGEEADSAFDDGMMPGMEEMSSMLRRGDQGSMMANMRGPRRASVAAGGMMSAHGAAFSIRSGPNRIFVRCAENETMQACVDAAAKLIDKVQTLKTSVPVQP